MTLGTLIEHCYSAAAMRWRGDFGGAVAAYLIATARTGRGGEA